MFAFATNMILQLRSVVQISLLFCTLFNTQFDSAENYQCTIQEQSPGGVL